MKTLAILATAVVLFFSCQRPDSSDKPEEPLDEAILGFPLTQKSIDRVDNMPPIPQPYKMLDWRQTALDYDNYVFDWNASDDVRPLVWLDKSSRNGPPEAFGL